MRRLFLIIIFLSIPVVAFPLTLRMESSDAVSASGVIEINSPPPYRVFQRTGTTGTITISGVYSEGIPSTIEARFNGGTWTVIDATPANGIFTGSLTGQTQGQGTLEVRFSNATTVTDSVAFVGIGDIYLVAGQSNATGHADNNQVWTHATLKAVNFANDYTWKELEDPYDSEAGQIDNISCDDCTGEEARGSWIPLVATDIMADQSVPVAFIPTSKGSTRISAWQPGTNHVNRNTLYGSMIYRGLQAGPIKAVLWQQGESDATAGTSQATYNAQLDALANGIAADLGVPLMASLMQNGAYPDANEAAIRAAITEAVGNNPNVLLGPDFSDMGTDDGAHFRSDELIQEAGERWFDAIEAEFY